MKYDSIKIVGLSYYVKDSCLYIMNDKSNRLDLKILSDRICLSDIDDVLSTVESVEYKHLPIFTKININGNYHTILSYSDCSYITIDNVDVYNIRVSNEIYTTRLYLNNSRVRNICSLYGMEVYSETIDSIVDSIDCNGCLTISMPYHTIDSIWCKGELYIRSIMTVNILYSVKPLSNRQFASHTQIKLCNHYIKFLTGEQYFIVGDDYYITKVSMKDKLYHMNSDSIITYLLKLLL